jgi:hypothetical protein
VFSIGQNSPPHSQGAGYPKIVDDSLTRITFA